MARRVDVDRSLEPVRIPADIFHGLCQHALELEASPPREECCGLIVGDSLERYRRQVRCRNEMTARHEQDPNTYPRDGRTAFFMSPHDYDKAMREAETAGQRITAVYHSHVGAGPYLSDMDVAYAEQPGFPFPEADQIVISVYERVVREVAVFRRTGNGFVGHPVEPVAP
ncbi:MAG: Mov34/MPN/PAD-1 family protein [Myxococcota bacterium]